MKALLENQPIAVFGTIHISDWDKKGQIRRLMIESVGGSKYEIHLSGKGKKLLNHIWEEVALEGRLIYGRDRNPNLVVDSFRVGNEWNEDEPCLHEYERLSRYLNQYDDNNIIDGYYWNEAVA